MHHVTIIARMVPLLLAGLAPPLAAGCQGAEAADDDDGAATDADTDADSDADSDADADTDTDSDTDTGQDPAVIPMDCTNCSGVGSTLEEMVCAFDLCDENAVVEQSYVTPCNFSGCTLEDTYEAVERFGLATNGLEAKLNGSYALVASGPATGTEHTTACDGSCMLTDPWSSETYKTYDVVEWRLILTAPEAALGFRFKYVFFSEEYDDFISTSYNDKFYVFLEAGSTGGGNPTVINFTDCREPETYFDFVCEAGNDACEEGQKYCYIAINSAFSDCCWYESCPNGYSSDVGTSIAGTGYECAASSDMDGPMSGSSTGWLQTSWPIDGGETFAVTFHIHDTSDGVYDSEVILDAFEFLKDPDQGTVPVE
ncbi:MAG TPA: choice-of-anchor L domain-containing protein [Polyangia bacterium]|nr:choice-of-anchor L domain-containing protein [Polyangia bacterium]